MALVPDFPQFIDAADLLRVYNSQLANEIARRYNTHADNPNSGNCSKCKFLEEQLKFMDAHFKSVAQTLKGLGYELCAGGHWKPPVGKPAGPLLESLDAEREAKNTLAALILDLAAAALPHMPVDEQLRVAGVKAINAALAVMEGRKP